MITTEELRIKREASPPAPSAPAYRLTTSPASMSIVFPFVTLRRGKGALRLLPPPLRPYQRPPCPKLGGVGARFMNAVRLPAFKDVAERMRTLGTEVSSVLPEEDALHHPEQPRKVPSERAGPI